jgi:CO dehydrogenase/acetyl-CoA synthase alpha subunit
MVHRNKATKWATHMERAERRKDIAEYVKNKQGTIEQAARAFKVTVTTVRQCCTIFGVPTGLSPKNVPHEKTYDVISYLLHNRCTCAQAAEEFGISKQRISAIRDMMRKAGIPIGIGAYLNNHVPKSKRGMVA